MDQLQDLLLQFSEAAVQFESNMRSLSTINNELHKFNSCFENFMTSVQLSNEATSYPEEVNDENMRHFLKPKPTRLPDHAFSGATHALKALSINEPNNTVHEPKEQPVSTKPKKTKPLNPAAQYKKIVSTLPVKFHSQPHARSIELILKLLGENADGLYLNDVLKLSKINRSSCVQYLNMLVQNNIVTKQNKKGVLFTLDSGKTF
eukprot:Colp12_sorted_trinity150504_noHs@26618